MTGILSTIFGGGPKVNVMQPPSDDDAETRAAAQAEARRLRAARGARSTIVTGPTGLQNRPQTLKTTLG